MGGGRTGSSGARRGIFLARCSEEPRGTALGPERLGDHMLSCTQLWAGGAPAVLARGLLGAAKLGVHRRVRIRECLGPR